ncbi:MAG: hypothetical protein JXB04_10790, partial [Kiritimatiellae bacterium]|nr:hypothetical protein [Kiritimatiellia bacterium]
MKQLSLRSKMMAAAAILVTVAVLVVSGFALLRFNAFGNKATVSANQGLETEVYALLSEAVRGAADEVGGLVRDCEQDAISLSLSSVMATYNRSRSGAETAPATATRLSESVAFGLLKDRFMEIHARAQIDVGSEKRPLYSQVRFIDENGQELLKLVNGRFDSDLASRAGMDWFESALRMQKGQAFNTGAVLAQNTGEPEMRAASPIFVDGRLRGLCVINMDWDLVRLVLERRHLGEHGYVYILNEKGVLVNHPRYGLKNPLNITDSKYGDLAQLATEHMLKGETGTGRYEFEGERKFAAHTPLQLGTLTYSIVASLPMTEALAVATAIESESRHQARVLIVTVSLLALLLIFVGWTASHFAAKAIADPIIEKERQLEESLHDIEETSLTLALDISEQYSV